MTMLARVVVDVVHVPGEVGIVADAVLPEAALPDAALPAFLTAGREGLFRHQGAGEVRLDQAPAQPVAGITRRQGTERMQVVGQHDDGVDPPGGISP